VINNKKRPNYLSRSKNLSGSLDELPKPKFTRSETLLIFFGIKRAILNLQGCKPCFSKIT